MSGRNEEEPRFPPTNEDRSKFPTQPPVGSSNMDQPTQPMRIPPGTTGRGSLDQTQETPATKVRKIIKKVTGQ